MFGYKNTNIYIEGVGIVKSSLKIENGKFASFDYNDSFYDIIKIYLMFDFL